MKLHAHLYEALTKINDKYAEDIARGIERGHKDEIESKIALKFLEKIEAIIKELERIEFEFDTENQINIPADLKWMKVSASSLSELIAKRSTREEEIIRGFIFHDALFRKIKEVRNWAKEYKDI